MYVFEFNKIITFGDRFNCDLTSQQVIDSFEKLFPTQFNFLIENDMDYELYVTEIVSDRDIVLFYKLNLVLYDANNAALYKLFFHEFHL